MERIYPSVRDTRWLLYPPQNAHIGFLGTSVFLEFAKGQELEMAKWLRETADMYERSALREANENQLTLTDTHTKETNLSTFIPDSDFALTASELSKQLPKGNHGKADDRRRI